MTIWKQARGDHIVSSAAVASTGLSLISWYFLFNGTIFGIGYYIGTAVFGTILPCWIISEYFPEWINNDLPKYHFWRDLLT